MKKLLSFFCALALLVTLTLPLFGTAAVSADTRASKTLYQQILERDGFIEGVWYPWFTHTYLGCGFTVNEVAGKYITNGWYDFGKVGIDTYGADKIYAEIYNLKALGYNMLAIAGSPYGEGVIYDNNGDVTGIKQDYLQNVARFLDICRDIGMPVMWNICFHTSSAADYYGPDVWNMICRMYGDNRVADHYAQRFVRPLCDVLDDYDDVVALIALTDEVENEMHDEDSPNTYSNKAFGTTKENILYFVNAINDVVKKEVPQIARTIAANSDDLGLYSDVEVDVLGRNRYSDAGTVPGIPGMFPTSQMLLTEWNLATAKGLSESEYSKIQLKFRDEMKRVGYQGGFQWCWQPNVKGGAMDMLAADAATTTDFRQSMYDRYYYTIDAVAAHQGRAVTLDTPALFYQSGDGLLEWIPSRQASTVTIQSSVDNGKTWRTVAEDVAQSSLIQNGKCVYQVRNAVATAIYRVTVQDGKGHTASAVTNRPGAAVDYMGESANLSIEKFRRPAVSKAAVSFSSSASLTLTSFGVNTNRPVRPAANLVQNGSFEVGGGQWDTTSFLGSTVKVVNDATAPEGNKSLHFDTRGTDTPAWHTFKVTVKPNTSYTLSAWVKGAYIADNNRFYGSLGVLNPATKTFATYSSYSGKRSRQDLQLYPPCWDNEWHLRSVTFDSGNLTEVVIGLYGASSEMWVDGIALYDQSQGTVYYSNTARDSVDFSYNYEYMRCDPVKSLTENVRFDNAKSAFWQSGAGWDNGFLSIVDGGVYGKSLKYTASAQAAGVSYIKWIPVKKNTQYVVTFDYKIIKEGAGRLCLATRRGGSIVPFLSREFIGSSLYEDENGWCTYSTMIDTASFDKVAIIVTDLGGEALIDNFRIFLPTDGSDVSDLPGGAGSTTGSVVRPTGTIAPPAYTTRSSATLTRPSSSADATTDSTTAATGDTTDTTVSADPSQDTAIDSTAPTDGGTSVPPTDGEDASADATPSGDPQDGGDTVWLVWIGLGAILLIGGGIALWLFLRKKKKPATEFPKNSSQT